MVSQSPPCINRPPWRQLIDWIIDPLEVQDRCSQMYGDIFTMQLGKYRPVAIIGNPKAIQEIFTLDAKQFDIGRANALAEPLVGRNSLMLLDGDHHRRERKLLMPPFYRQAVQTYAQQICLITEQVASQ